MAKIEAAHAGATTEAAEWKRGGRTVLFSALGYGTGPLLFLTTASVFIKPTMAATGWSTNEVLISPLVIVLFTFLGPIVGRHVDRRGVRQAILVGMIPYIGLLTLFATLPINRITYFALAVGIGLFGAFGYQIPYSRAVAGWFDRGAGKAFGLVGVGGATMPLFGIPLVSWTIYRFGWQAGYLVLAVVALLFALPAALFGVQEQKSAREDSLESGTGLSRSLEQDQSDEPGRGSLRSALQSPRFWIFSSHIFFVGGAASAFLSNMQPMLLDGGLGVAQATAVTTLFTAGIIVGRLGAGVLMDLLNRYLVALPVFALSVFGAIALANVEHAPLLLIMIAAVLTAAGQGAEGDIGAYFILKEYGRADFGTLYAFAGMFGGAGALIVPYLFGYIRDTFGDYSVAAYLGAALYASGAMSLVLFGILGRREKPSVTFSAANKN